MNPLDDIRCQLLILIAAADNPQLRETEVMLHELLDIIQDNMASLAGGFGDY